MTGNRIRVLVVDDSMLFREVLIRGISGDPGIDVVGAAGDPFEARDKIIDLKPDVMTLDVEMPKMNGIEFLRRLLPQYPIPVVVVSATAGNVFDALDAGAVDFVAKPNMSSSMSVSSLINELVVKIKIASMAKVTKTKNPGIAQNSSRKAGFQANEDLSRLIIAIGASTGGTEATYDVLKEFPEDMPGIVIVQHMPPVFTRMYAERLNKTCRLEVKEAADGDVLQPGKVLIAPGDYHMELVKKGRTYSVRCFKGEKVNGHCPSVDVLFNSVMETAGRDALGIILTGMGNDGAKGLLNLRKKGAYTIGQDEKTSIVYGMPMVAYNIGAVAKQLPLQKIPEEVMEYIGNCS